MIINDDVQAVLETDADGVHVGQSEDVYKRQKYLWEEGYNKGGLPIIFNFATNHYGMGGQTRGETMGYDMVARIAAGMEPNALHAERVDGYNPLAVIDAYARKLPVAKTQGPVLLDVVTYRVSGHSPSDSSSYRTKEEIEAWQEQDSIVSFGKQLVEAGVCKEADLAAIREKVAADMLRNMKLAIDETCLLYTSRCV